MSNTEQPGIQWYLARDGQQFGPVSEAELRKLIELGHLRASDLVWNAAYTDWQPAQAAIDQLKLAAPPTAAPTAPPQTQSNPAQTGTISQPATGANPTTDPTTTAPQRDATAGRSLREAVRAAEPEPQPQTQAPSGYAPAGDGGPSGYGATGYEFTGGESGPAGTAVSAPEGGRRHGDEFEFAEAAPRRRRSPGKAIAAMLAIGVLGFGGWVAYENRDQLGALMASSDTSSDGTPVVRADGETATRVNAAAPGGSAAPAGRDVALLKTPLWASIAKAFPNWVDERKIEADQMQRTGQQPAVIRDHLIKSIAKLRRQHANEALAASPNTLRSLASAFLANLQSLTQRDSDTCYAFISRGETSPKVLALMSDPQASGAIEKQMRLVIDAIVDGRDKPNTYLPPRRNDYKVISDELTKMGWTNDDMTLFGDPQALAKADPGKVCQLVTDWFTAQLMVTDPGIQSRLLVQSLRPVVAG